MKFRVTFKTPDTMAASINEALEDANFPDTEEGQEARTQLKFRLMEVAENYINYGEVTTLEFDTDNNTVRSIPVRRPLKQSEYAINVWLKDNPGWDLGGGGKNLIKSFKFPDFNSALGFVTRIGAYAERRDHHPTIQLTWGLVTVSWSSDDAGGITVRDFAAASACDSYYQSSK